MNSQNSVTVSPTSNGGTGATATIIETSRLVPLLVIVALIAGGALVGSTGIALYTNQRFDEIEHRHAQRIDQLMAQYAISEREARVLQERLNDMKVELIKRGIPLSDH